MNTSYITRKEAAARAGVSVRTIDRWAANGKLPRFRNLRGLTGFRAKDVYALARMDSHENVPPEGDGSGVVE